MNRKIFNIIFIVLVLCFFQISLSEFTPHFNIKKKEGENSVVIQKNNIGLLSITKTIEDPFQLLCPLAELLADETVRAVILLLDYNKVHIKCAWPFITDFQRLKNAYHKPIIVYSETRLSNDDYIAACGADAIVVAPLSKVGGIGYSFNIEYCFDKDKEEGKLLNLIYSGKFMNEGLHIPPTSELAQMYERFAHENFNILINDIAARRSKSSLNKNRWIDGSWFNAKDAMTLGLIDAVADKIDLIGYVINFARGIGLNVTNIGLSKKNQLDSISFDHIHHNEKPKVGILKIEELNHQSRDAYGQYLLELFQNKSIDKIVLYISCINGEKPLAKSINTDILKLKQIYRKPIIAYIDIALSAGYYISAAADYIIASKGAYIGCIGAKFERWDLTKKNKIEQLRTNVVSTGKFTNIGNPHVCLTGENKDFLQKEIDYAHKIFIQDIKTLRPKLKNVDENSWADAQKFTAHEALAIGLIDALGTPLDSLYFGDEEKNYALNELSFIFKAVNEKK